MDILVQSAVVVALMSFALAAITLARNVKNKLFIALAGLYAVISLWATSFALDGIWGGLYEYHLLFNLWLSPIGLIFVNQLVQNDDFLSRLLRRVSLAMAFVLSWALFFKVDHLPWAKELIYFSPGFLVIETLRMILLDRRWQREGREPGQMLKVRWKRDLIYFGALIVLGFSVMDHVHWMGRVVPSIGNLVLTGYLFFLSQAVSQQRFLNFGALFTKFLMLIVIALVLTSIYLVLVGWIKDSPPLLFLNSFIASLLVILILEPLEKGADWVTHKLVTKKRQILNESIEEAESKLTGVVDPAALSNSIFNFLDQVFRPDRMAVFVMTGDETKFRRVAYVGPDELEPAREILATHALFQYCERQRKMGQVPAILDQHLETEAARSATRAQKENFRDLIRGLHALGCNLVIPFFESGKILGFVTVAAQKGGDWNVLPVIYGYFDHVAQVLRNMDVYVRQREKERLATLGEMAAGLAHEIRNPLGAIKGAAQFLDPTKDRPESGFLKIIIEEVDRLNRVVTQFLDYSKPKQLEMQRVDLVALAEKTVALLKPTVRASTQLDFHPPQEGPLWIQGAAEQIQQMLMNLVQNALKAVGEKPNGRVSVSLESGEGEVSVIVEDNGAGIKREHMDKIFIPFFTTSPSGTGLGLSISQKIVEAHQGRIELASEPGRFTKFWVILPAAEPNADKGLRRKTDGLPTAKVQESIRA